MRNNQPIVDKEYLLSDQIFIVSRTDISGTIVSCNQDFIEASGYSENELIGQPHNLLRHPDMPVEAFADFWACLKQGQSWHGIVKNRRKDGLYYWVHAGFRKVASVYSIIMPYIGERYGGKPAWRKPSVHPILGNHC